MVMNNKGDNPLILIVDDDSFLLCATERAIKKGGYRTLTASDGSMALEVVCSQPQKIDLLLTDIIMPGMNGFDLAKTFITSYPEAKILFMSGSVDFKDIFHDCAEFQNKAQFLEKPFSVADLYNKIVDLLGKL